MCQRFPAGASLANRSSNAVVAGVAGVAGAAGDNARVAATRASEAGGSAGIATYPIQTPSPLLEPIPIVSNPNFRSLK
jgi:hypothetical protein